MEGDRHRERERKWKMDKKKEKERNGVKGWEREREREEGKETSKLWRNKKVKEFSTYYFPNLFPCSPIDGPAKVYLTTLCLSWDLNPSQSESSTYLEDQRTFERAHNRLSNCDGCKKIKEFKGEKRTKMEQGVKTEGEIEGRQMKD